MTKSNANPNRRKFMSSAVASVASVAVVSPSIAAAQSSAEPDPIFAAIASYSCACAEVEASIEAMGVITDAVGDVGRDYFRVPLEPSSIFGNVEPVNAHSHDEIDAVCDDALKGARSLLRPAKRRRTAACGVVSVDIDAFAAELDAIEETRARLHASFDQDVAQLSAAWKACGLDVARDREEVAWDDWGRSLRATTATIPTSAAGVAAFVAFMREEIFCDRGSPGEDVEECAWRTLSEASRRLAEALAEAARSADGMAA
jgi:hypothetical protein